jgi:hypothetical protein
VFVVGDSDAACGDLDALVIVEHHQVVIIGEQLEQGEHRLTGLLLRGEGGVGLVAERPLREIFSLVVIFLGGLFCYGGIEVPELDVEVVGVGGEGAFVAVVEVGVYCVQPKLSSTGLAAKISAAASAIRAAPSSRISFSSATLLA